LEVGGGGLQSKTMLRSDGVLETSYWYWNIVFYYSNSVFLYV